MTSDNMWPFLATDSTNCIQACDFITPDIYSLCMNKALDTIE